METQALMDEVRAIVDGPSRTTSDLDEGKDPSVLAYEMITDHKKLKAMLYRHVDDAMKEWVLAAKEVEGAKRYGGKHIAAADMLQYDQGPMKSLNKLRSEIDRIISHVSQVAGDARRSRGSMGIGRMREDVELEQDLLADDPYGLDEMYADIGKDARYIGSHNAAQDRGLGDNAPGVVSTAKMRVPEKYVTTVVGGVKKSTAAGSYGLNVVGTGKDYVMVSGEASKLTAFARQVAARSAKPTVVSTAFGSGGLLATEDLNLLTREDRDFLDEKKWIKGAIKEPGRVHRYLGVSEGEDIPAAKIDAAISRLKGKESKSAEDKSMMSALVLAKRFQKGKKFEDCDLFFDFPDDVFDDLTEGDILRATIYEATYYKSGKDLYVDTAYMNALKGKMKGCTMGHMGFGEFSLKCGKEGRIEFDRSRGQDFPGQSGRSHKVYDDKGGKLVKKMMAEMKGTAKASKAESLEDYERELAKFYESIRFDDGDSLVDRIRTALNPANRVKFDAMSVEERVVVAQKLASKMS